MSFRRASHVAWRKIGDETVLIDLKTKKLYGLNPSGGFFWHALDGIKSPEEMLQLLPEPVRPSTSEPVSALESFFRTLQTNNLVVTEVEGEELPVKAPAYPEAGYVPP